MNNCEKIQFELSLLNQDQPLTGSFERHLKECAECREFASVLEKQNQQLSDLRRPTPADWAWLVRSASGRTVETATMVSTPAFSHPMARKERTFGKIAITVALAAGLLVSAIGILPWLPIAGKWNLAEGPVPQDRHQAKLPAAKSAEKSPTGNVMRKLAEAKSADPSDSLPKFQADAEDRVGKEVLTPEPALPVPPSRTEAKDSPSTGRDTGGVQYKSEMKSDSPTRAPGSGSVPGPAPGPLPGPAQGPAGSAASSGTTAPANSPPGTAGFRSIINPGLAANGERNSEDEKKQNPPPVYARNMNPDADWKAVGVGVGGGGGRLGAQNSIQNATQNSMQNGQFDGQGFQVANAPLTDQADARSIIRGVVPTPEQKVRFTLLLCQQSATDVWNRAQTELEMANVSKEQIALKKSEQNKFGSEPNKAESPTLSRGAKEKESQDAPRATGTGLEKNSLMEQKKILEQQPAYMVQSNRNFYLAVVPAKNPDDIVKSYDDIVKKDIPALLSGLRSPSNKKDLESLLQFLKNSEKEFAQLAVNLPQQAQWLNRVIELNKKGIALIQSHNP